MINTESDNVSKRSVVTKAFKAAFPHTLPIFAGFWFLSLAYGIYMNVSGFSFVYPMLMSMIIFGGSLEFVTVMLLSPFAPLQAMFVTIFMEQWKKEKVHVTALVGIGATLLCLIIFGSNSFMLPSMAAILLVLTALLHKWRGNMLLSIAAGTICYMILIKVVV